MSVDLWPLITILGATVYATRVVGLVAVPEGMTRPWLERRLKLVPVAILAALVAPGLIGPGGAADPSILLAATVTAITSRFISQPMLALLAGLATLAVLRS